MLKPYKLKVLATSLMQMIIDGDDDDIIDRVVLRINQVIEVEST